MKFVVQPARPNKGWIAQAEVFWIRASDQENGLGQPLSGVQCKVFPEAEVDSALRLRLTCRTELLDGEPLSLPMEVIQALDKRDAEGVRANRNAGLPERHACLPAMCSMSLRSDQL